MKATSTKVNVPSEAGHETKIIFRVYRGRARLSNADLRSSSIDNIYSAITAEYILSMVVVSLATQTRVSSSSVYS